MVKKFLLLIICILSFTGTVLAETTDYKIRYDGSTMVIIPYSYSVPSSVQQNPLKIQSAPKGIPFYTKKGLPKGRNKTHSV